MQIEEIQLMFDELIAGYISTEGDFYGAYYFDEYHLILNYEIKG